MSKKSISNTNWNKSMQYFISNMFECFALFEIIYDQNKLPCDYKFLEVNKAFLRIWKLKKEDLIGKRLLEIFPDFTQNFIDVFYRVSTTCVSEKVDGYLHILDKYLNAKAFIPVEGQIIALFRDVTSIKRESEYLKKHRYLFEGAHDAVFYIKPNYKIIDANKSAIELYGYSYEEFLKTNLQQLRHPSTMKEFDKQMSQADRSGITYETIHVKKDGSSFPVEVSSKSILIDEEKIKIHIVRDISERKKSEATIIYLANYDSLTDIFNRASFLKQLDSSIEQSKRGRHKFALMLFDIDKFKFINDTYGHAAGDKILKTVAQRIRNTLRNIDVFGRLGGDEFVIIQPYVKYKDDIITLTDRILESFKDPVIIDGSEIYIKLSIGISSFPGFSKDGVELIHFADMAMYSSKQNGGNSYTFFDDLKI